MKISYDDYSDNIIMVLSIIMVLLKCAENWECNLDVSIWLLYSPNCPLLSVYHLTAVWALHSDKINLTVIIRCNNKGEAFWCEFVGTFW